MRIGEKILELSSQWGKTNIRNKIVLIIYFVLFEIGSGPILSIYEDWIFNKEG